VFLGGCLFLLAWELVVLVFGISQQLLPGPLQIAGVIIKNSQLYLAASIKSLEFAVAGFIMGSILGIVLALIINVSESLERMLLPLLVVTFVVPKIILAPLFVLWFGAGKLYFTLVPLLLVFFPVLQNTLTGLKSVPDELLDIARLYTANGRYTYRHFMIPQALPDMMSGLKIGVTQAVVGIIVAEFVVPEQGLGELMIIGIQYGDSILTWGSIVLIGVIGILFYKVVEAVETRLVFWRESVMGQ